MIRTVKLGELASVKGGKRLPKGINLITTPNSHPYIRVRDLNNRHTLELNADFEYVDDETQKSIARYIVDRGDIVLSIVGYFLIGTLGDFVITRMGKRKHIKSKDYLEKSEVR